MHTLIGDHSGATLNPGIPRAHSAMWALAGTLIAGPSVLGFLLLAVFGDPRAPLFLVPFGWLCWTAWRRTRRSVHLKLSAEWDVTVFPFSVRANKCDGGPEVRWPFFGRIGVRPDGPVPMTSSLDLAESPWGLRWDGEQLTMQHPPVETAQTNAELLHDLGERIQTPLGHALGIRGNAPQALDGLTVQVQDWLHGARVSVSGPLAPTFRIRRRAPRETGGDRTGNPVADMTLFVEGALPASLLEDGVLGDLMALVHGHPGSRWDTDGLVIELGESRDEGVIELAMQVVGVWVGSPEGRVRSSPALSDSPRPAT